MLDETSADDSVMGDSCTGSPLDPVRATETGTHENEPGASDKMAGFAHGLWCDAPQLETGQKSQSDLRIRDRAGQLAQKMVPGVRTSAVQSRIVARPGQPGSSEDAVVAQVDSSVPEASTMSREFDPWDTEPSKAGTVEGSFG